MVDSEKAYARESRTFEKKIAKERELVDKDIWHLGNELFTSKNCACEAAKKITKTWKFHEVDGDLDDPDGANGKNGYNGIEFVEIEKDRKSVV